MAELMLKIGDHPSGLDEHYKDGDIVCAFSNRRIRSVHAEHICRLDNFGFNKDGLRPSSLASKFYEAVYQYKFERISKTEIRRTDLVTLEQEIFSHIPNVNGEYIHLESYLARRIAHPNHKIFGTQKGKEYWYGGKVSSNHTTLDKVWSAIETDTAERAINYTKWPLTPAEKRIFLGVGVDDFDIAEEDRLVNLEMKLDNQAPDYDPDLQAISYKRRANINWRSLSLGNNQDIQNPAKEIDFRNITKDRVKIVAYKKRKTLWQL